MTIAYKNTYTIYFLNSDTTKQFASKDAAMAAASNYVGNNRFATLFGHDLLYGPGDGTTSVIVRRDVSYEES